VNRTASLIYKNFGEIPAPGPLTEADRKLLDGVRSGFDVVGSLIEKHRQKQALSEAMRLAADANRYLAAEEPWKLKGDDQRERLATVLYTAAQAVRDVELMLSPFLPHATQAVHEALGGEGVVAPMPDLVEVDDLDGGPSYPIL